MFARQVWGIDLGRSAVKAVLVQAAGEDLEILEAEIVPLEGPPPDPSEDPTRDGRLWKALSRFQEKRRLTSAEICVAIPAQNTLVRDLTVARVGGRKLEEMVRYEASNEIPFVLEEVQWDYALFRDDPSQPTRKGLLFAVKKNVVETYLRVLAQLELGQVSRVTLSPLALLAFLRLQIEDGRRTLALDLGAENTNIVVLDDGGFWLRNMLTGGNRITAVLQEEFNLDFDAAQRAKESVARSRYAQAIAGAVRPALHDLARNVKTNMSYMERAIGVGDLGAAYLFGGGGRLPWIRQQLSSTLRQELQDLKELRRLTVSPGAGVDFVRANIDRLAVAVGAGLCGLERGVGRVSFLPKTRARTAVLSRSKRAALVVGLILWAALLSAYVIGRLVCASVEAPLKDYRDLATIEFANEKELAAASDTARMQQELQRLLAASAGRSQPFAILNDVVRAFAAADRGAVFRFRVVSFVCGDPPTPGPQPKTDETTREADAAKALAPSPPSDRLVGHLTGRITPTRGGTAVEGYRRFADVLLDAMRTSPTLAKVKGQATFRKGSASVSTEEGDWSRDVRPGDVIRAASSPTWYVVEEVVSQTELHMTEAFAEEDVSGDYVVCRVLPGQFNQTTLEFTVDFEVPKQQPEDLQVLLRSES
jgi:type IV pilus assembly protein PilM